MKLLRLTLILALMSFLAASARAGTITFDFDNCTPGDILYHSTPLDQTCAGVSAHFSSTTDGYRDGGFSVQNANTTFWVLSLFTGNYFVPNSLSPGAMNISFSEVMNSITFPFATADFHQNEVPTTIQLDLYLGTTLVGSVQAHGEYGSDTMPMGVMAFAGANFDHATIWVPWQPLGTSDFLVDTIAVTTAGQGVPEPSSLLLLGSGILSCASLLRGRLGMRG